ncbi:MAG TPA: EscU/YscU/HrcU family type III secretion system export apparatus switch protein [Clostridia bacterium]|nr:EscU/YscU/HrcU family type III secretion system export apparatus switch protein [Clostridia bacterium]
MDGKKLKEAAALRYDPEKGGAPEIVALGKGEIADRIIEKAKENDVPLYEDAKLAHTLNYLHVGDEIPRELYEVIAQILVFVSNLDDSYGTLPARGDIDE